MRRGQAAYKTYTARHESNLPNDPALLEGAIVDLRVGGIGGETLPASLILRSIERRKQGHYKDATEDLNEALEALSHVPEDRAAPAVQMRFSCAAGLVECNGQLALESGDAAATADACKQFLALPLDHREANIATPVYGCRLLLETDASKYRDVVRKVALNIRNRLAVLSPAPKEYTFAASHTAQLLIRTCRNSVDEHSLRVAYELTTTAFAGDENAPAELLASAAQAALQLAKSLLLKGATEEATGLFADAGEHFETAAQIALAKGASEGFSLQIAHSKAGEAYMRAHAYSGEQDHAEKATANLARSRELGNTTPELVGMLGDVAYRQGRRTSDVTKLREALRLKAEARTRGNLSRENRSVSAAAALVLWRISGEISGLTIALRNAIEAVEADPSWPWPFFQLSEMAILPSDVRRNGTTPLLPTALRPDLVRMVRDGEFEQLIHIGSKLAIGSQEFARSEFGSRQPVYVLDDPHDLLRQTVVFKETEADTASRERNNVTEFAAHLSRIKARPVLHLPEPLLVLPQENKKVVYVMRRARGIQLGKTTLTSSNTAETTRSYENAIEFLAHYHVWRLGGRAPRPSTPNTNATLVRKALRLWPFVGFSATVGRELQAEFLSVFPRDLPSIPKKDAHPENWLVDDHGNLVMLDLESSGECPLFFEVVQLLDDYPFLAADRAGWERRMEYCDSYISCLAAAGLDLQFRHASGAEAYGVFALLRIVFGLARNRTRRGRANSSAVRAGTIRDRHSLALLEYVAESGPYALRPLAGRIRDSVQTLALAKAEVTH
jgi:tetratricopeptide (TPR) repeat protein